MCFAVLENPVLFPLSPASPAAKGKRNTEARGRREGRALMHHAHKLQTNSQAGRKGFGEEKA